MAIDGREREEGETGTRLMMSRPVRTALLFGAVAAVLAVTLAPMAERRANALIASGGAGLDRMSTGSIAPLTNSYTIRRSVLQSSPNAVCIIRSNGGRSGDC